jgi:hypothetical protein
MWFIGSGQGSEDGTFRYTLIRPDNSSVDDPLDFEGNLMTYGASQTRRMRYVVYGHWIGNGLTKLNAWLDDIYIQSGTQARVEIGNASNWQTCTHREIQTPVSWSDTSITITLNQGSFAVGETAYLFVVDADGNVNTQGYPVTFTLSGFGPPSPPIGLKIK